MIQVTLVQIDNYGPWTTFPAPKREADLQMLQSKLYCDIQNLFSAGKALAFAARYDNMLVFTSGTSIDQHKRIMDSINLRYPVSISMAIANAKTPLEAQKKATQMLVEKGGSQDEKRCGILVFDKEAENNKKMCDFVQAAHIDIDGITQYTDMDVYDSYMKVLSVQEELSVRFLRHNALIFFAGGDNYISMSNGMEGQDYLKIFAEIEGNLKLPLKAGVGVAGTAEQAVKLASAALKEIRKTRDKNIIIKKKL